MIDRDSFEQSPLTLPEYIGAQLVMSMLRTLIGVGGACLFAYLLFRYSIFSLGFPLIAFFVFPKYLTLGSQILIAGIFALSLDLIYTPSFAAARG